MIGTGAVVHMDRRTITCIIQCESEDALRRSQEFTKERIALDEAIHKTFRTYPGGVERLEHRSYRLGDYFDRIELQSDVAGGPFSFALVFHTHQDVDSYWKDLVVAALRRISEATGAKIHSITQST